MKFLKPRTLTPSAQLFIGVPLLIVLVFLIASFALQATTNARLSDELTSIKRDYELIVDHTLIFGGTYHSSDITPRGYMFNVLSERLGEPIIYACYPDNVEKTKRQLAEQQRKKDLGIALKKMTIFGRFNRNREIMYSIHGKGMEMKGVYIYNAD